VLQLNGGLECPLTVSVMPPLPVPERVTYRFEAGLHRIDFLTLEDDDVLYLAEGAILEAIPPHDPEPCTKECDWAGQKKYRNFIIANGKKNIRITGRGILDTSKLNWHARSPLVFSGCENITVEGITVIGTPEWTLTFGACRGVLVDDVRFLGHFENSDGIDVCQSQDVEIRNSFLRTGDDAICVKSFATRPAVGGRNILAHDCVIWNDKVRCMGIACETKSDIDHVVFRDCDVVRSLATWTRELGSLCIIVCDSGVISDVTFENISVEDERQYVINCMILKDRWSTQTEAGQIRNITYRNITAPTGSRCNFLGYDETHTVSDVLIDGYTENGRRLTEQEMRIERNAFTERIAVTE
jgi:polygalacturonase